MCVCVILVEAKPKSKVKRRGSQFGLSIGLILLMHTLSQEMTSLYITESDLVREKSDPIHIYSCSSDLC